MKHTLLLLLLFCSPIYAAPELLKARHTVNQVSELTIPIHEYWVSEKLDGVRGYWNGKQLFTRTGNIINAPSFFTANWPNIPMDGELWLKRDSFSQLNSITSRKKPEQEQWQKVRFMIFDLPTHQGVFSERVQAMNHIVSQSDSRFLSIIKQQQFQDKAQLEHYYQQVITQGGEGLMLHHQDNIYHGGRTAKLIKLKPRYDAEAVVLEQLPGKGKFSGMLGALKVRNVKDNKVFKIGTGFTTQQRKNPPAIGDIVTYSYAGLTVNGLPRFASFVRIKAYSPH